MILFASDLDNTLIHSYKRADEGDICVEVKDGKKLSYMTPYAYDKLRSINKNQKYVFMPVTTRSLEQYNRIDFFDGKPAQLALAANGGILLENGVINKEWLRESVALIKDSVDDFYKGIEYLKKDEDVYFEIRIVDELFLFTKSHKPLETKEKLRQYISSEKSTVYNIGDKVYIFPDILSKGTAIQRIREKFDFEKIICAGDSEFDVPMLNIADFAYCPEGICDCIANKNLKGFDISEKRFADQLLEEIEG
ncbi:MAG: HAD hydrolase family protein [Oscillospiraceae bacterium]|nr:HAD hydrolase family protein [Oscillospiraceae bacterium]MBR6600049.1 HAD hydrolase family protein [Oscillospiraceae bacterium]